jgi:thiol:disulfide interchange protein DsbD
MMSWLRRIASAGLLCVLASAVPQAARAVDTADLLPVDQAFALTADASGNNQIALHWGIARGYYLYRQRISVQVESGMQAGALQLPPGEAHHDPFFGDVQTYRNQLTGMLPGIATSTSVRLKVKYQGCADLGVCYPPQTRVLEVAVAAPAPAQTQTTPSGATGTDALSRALSGGNPPTLQAGLADEPALPAEQAFAFEAIVGDAHTLLLRFTPAKGYYLYRDKTALSLSGARGVALGQPRWPVGTLHLDEHFGNVVVYFKQVDVPVPMLRSASRATDVTLTARFQGCQTGGICYPPMTRSVALQLPAAGTTGATNNASVGATSVAIASRSAGSAPIATEVAPTTAAPVAHLTAAPAAAEDTQLASDLASTHRWVALLGFFGAGLLLAFTPCVLPMIPILSGLIAGHGTRLGTRRALLLSLVYVVANALVFTAAGVAAGLLGANLQAAFQNPWIIGAFAALFVALALSSFGLYELQLPMALRSRLGAATDRQRGGSLAGVAAMGALSALIVGPCVAPPLAGAVLYIGQRHDPIFGGVALFLLAMGMGAPLLAFGAAAGRGMPTSGPWMSGVQRVFGFVFLGLAVWMLSRILPGPVTLALWGVLVLGAAAWALVAQPSHRRHQLLARFAALLLGVIGAAQLFGALAGGSDPLQPLAGLVGAHPSEHALEFRTIKSAADLDREVAAANAAGKPVMFDFYADWCVSCKEMERDTFSQATVHDALSNFVLLKADVTANDAVDQALMQHFGIIGPPATLFFNRGSEQRALRLIGFEPGAAFVERVHRVAL